MRRYASSHDDVTIETYYYGSLGLKRIHNIEIRVWVFDPLDQGRLRHINDGANAP